MKHTPKPLILLVGLLLTILPTASCAPPLTEADMTLTQVALVSPTPTTTSTPRPTATPTLPPTITPAPTPTPLPFYVRTQRDGSTLVRNVMHGFQFELPEGWTCPSAWEVSNGMGYCYFRPDNGDGSRAVLEPRFASYNLSLEGILGWQGGMARGFGMTIQREGVMTNQHGTPLGYLHLVANPTGQQTIRMVYIYFEAEGRLIEFFLDENLSLVMNDIESLKESIQLIDG